MTDNRIDLNCDLGESFGPWPMGHDEQVMPHISSASIACGFHAGDPKTMCRSVALCMQHGVAIGAHPAWPDLVGFGRRQLSTSEEETYGLVLYQIGALAAVVRAAGGRLAHVKPHGALYNQAATDARIAAAIARAVADFDSQLVLYGLAGSQLIEAGQKNGLQVVREAFADRRYLANGQLQPRTQTGAVIQDCKAAAEQALAIARGNAVTTAEGKSLPVTADSLCIHGDRDDAAVFAASLHATLTAAGIQISAPLGRPI